MPYCGQCGMRLFEGDRFCTRCGSEARLEPPLRLPGLESDEASRRQVPALEEATPREAQPSQSLVPRTVTILPATSEGVVDRDPISLQEVQQVPSFRRLAFGFGVIVMLALSGYCAFLVRSRTAVPEAPSRPASGAKVKPAPHRETTNGPQQSATWRIDAESTRATRNETDALGAPDSRMATVLPGGTLALVYNGEAFFNGEGADVQIVGRKGDRTPYAIFARTEGSGDWVRIDLNRRGFPNGSASHDFGHHGLARSNAILIMNDGATNLNVDAVIPLHLQALPADTRAHDAPRH